jgi:hypothetical protein
MAYTCKCNYLAWVVEGRRFIVKIVVIGGTGLIGSKLVTKLSEDR